MRADRLVATLLIMQARGKVTATELATELEISIATARRDLEALSAAGIPVYSQPGRGGGWRLLGDGRTNLTGLSSAEIRALFVLIGPASRADSDARAARRKLVQALPETFRAEADAAANSTTVDVNAWDSIQHPDAGRDPVVRELQHAVIQQHQVQMRYAGWKRPESDHIVEPWRVVDTGKSWYLFGKVDGEARTFRADRIRNLRVTAVQTARPSEEEIDAAWTATTLAVQQQRSRATATIRTSSEVVAWLRPQFGPGHVLVSGDQVIVSAPTDEMIARMLVGWADRIVIIEPVEVRVEVHRIGVAAANRNQPSKEHKHSGRTRQ